MHVISTLFTDCNATRSRMIEICLKSDYQETLTNFCSAKEPHCLLLASLFHLLSLSSSNIHIKDINIHINIHIKEKGKKTDILTLEVLSAQSLDFQVSSAFSTLIHIFLLSFIESFCTPPLSLFF